LIRWSKRGQRSWQNNCSTGFERYMKALMMLGAIVGFLIGSGFGLAGSSPWPAALWRACAAALVAAVLARWWGRVWLNSLRDALHDARADRSTPAPDAKSGTRI
jgi:hypothetical protein